jgi:hypothetical protein
MLGIDSQEAGIKTSNIKAFTKLLPSFDSFS